MIARRLVEGTSFDPEVVEVVTAAFDAAWSEISANFGPDPNSIESARERLAEAVLSVANEETSDVEALKAGALQAMAKDFRVTLAG
jgi:hypothetical protein